MLQFLCRDKLRGCIIQFVFQGSVLPENGITFGEILDFNNKTDPESRLSNGTISWLEKQCDCTISPYVNRILPTIYCFLVFFGLIANVVVFYLTVHLRKRHVVDIYVLNLCVADGLLLLSTIPNDIMEKYGNFPFPDIGCKIVSYATFIFMNCTRYSVVILALDRYIAVGWPISGRKCRTRKFANVLCSAVWTFAIVSSIYCLKYRKKDKGECVWDLSSLMEDQISLSVFFYARITIIFYLPQTILILLYIAIIVTLLRNQEEFQEFI
ncbi:Oidioi.mRNA.OKI2018_I69.chr2.g7420.t1.cds [Oikopleura dioica]|uniref:Oidioi.mRNA.OKI2018_I69.chr2.g7420.t1.cds n=1 Tax=Oikopleura dioica TaxID=34765 RepID=A0ABN7TF47_OIKDI|nr:Oidioi.mRNA.OKI2018_I69.chr2.g7420.t1.cds [Oikopleura dioica]